MHVFIHFLLSLFVVMCPSLGTIDNGNLSTDATNINTVVTVHCNSGYQLQGSNILVCQSNGQWSDDKPSCHSGTYMLYNVTQGVTKCITNHSLYIYYTIVVIFDALVVGTIFVNKCHLQNHF